MVLVTAVVLAGQGQPGSTSLPLAVTILVTHLGLLFWETRYVSPSLAYPGLKPPQKGA